MAASRLSMRSAMEAIVVADVLVTLALYEQTQIG
jgi:hypothetical protein